MKITTRAIKGDSVVEIWKTRRIYGGKRQNIRIIKRYYKGKLTVHKTTKKPVNTRALIGKLRRMKFKIRYY